MAMIDAALLERTIQTVEQQMPEMASHCMAVRWTITVATNSPPANATFL